MWCHDVTAPQRPQFRVLQNMKMNDSWRNSDGKYLMRSISEFCTLSPTMLSSFVATVNEFFLAGFVSLAIVSATIRAYLTKLPIYLEWGGISGFFVASFLLTICGWIYIILTRHEFCSGDDQKDEEMDLVGDMPTASRPIIHSLPVVIDWGCEGRRRTICGWKENGVRLEEDSRTFSSGHI